MQQPIPPGPPVTRPASPPDAIAGVSGAHQLRLHIALGILAATLLGVIALTLNATAAAWERSSWISAVAEPARGATESVEAALFSHMKGIEGLRATGSPEYARQVEVAVRREREAVQLLYRLSDRVNPGVRPAVQRLETALDSAWALAGGGVPGSLGWAAEFQAYQAAVEAAQQVERVILAETITRRNRISGLEARAAAGGLMMVPIAFCCLWIALRAALRLREAAKVAQARSAEVERIAQEKAALVHDVTRYLRQPLGTVAGRLATLELSAASALDPPSRTALSAASGELRRALQILHDLAELSTADAGAMPMRRGRVDLSTVLDGATSGLIGWASAKGVRLMQVPPPEVELVTDAERLRGILRNLVASAIELASQGSVIQIESSIHSYSPDGSGGPWVALVVSETPLATPDAPRLPAGELLRRQIGPSGELGLALSQRVTALLGGTLWAYGGTGGTHFALWIPAEGAAVRSVVFEDEPDATVPQPT